MSGSGSEDAQIRRALARNERYQREFVERDNICPYARRCRETGRLHRRVLLQADLAPDAAVEEVLSFEGLPQGSIEVGMLLFPNVTAGFTEFCGFAERVRELYASKVKRPGFYIVVFHPEAPVDTTDPDRLVSFLRRSPDPTLQISEARVLESVRGSVPGGSVYLPPEKLLEALTKPPVLELSVSERIAKNNFETIGRIGLDEAKRLLDELRTWEPS